MRSSEIGGTEENIRIRVTTAREKIQAATQLFTVLLGMGETEECAEDIASHETKHTLAHNGSGHMGVRSNDMFLEAYYEPEGELTREEKKKIAEAVGINEMSHKDRKHAK